MSLCSSFPLTWSLPSSCSWSSFTSHLFSVITCRGACSVVYEGCNIISGRCVCSRTTDRCYNTFSFSNETDCRHELFKQFTPGNETRRDFKFLHLYIIDSYIGLVATWPIGDCKKSTEFILLSYYARTNVSESDDITWGVAVNRLDSGSWWCHIEEMRGDPIIVPLDLQFTLKNNRDLDMRICKCYDNFAHRKLYYFRADLIITRVINV